MIVVYAAIVVGLVVTAISIVSLRKSENERNKELRLLEEERKADPARLARAERRRKQKFRLERGYNRRSPTIGQRKRMAFKAGKSTSLVIL